jgi:hypothetical protein
MEAFNKWDKIFNNGIYLIMILLGKGVNEGKSVKEG